MGIVVGSAVPVVAASPMRPYLALDQDFPDPAVLQFHGVYYAYSTNAGGLNVPVATASRLYGKWSVSAHDALPAVGSWANTGLTWAPDVSRLASGRFLMYYTAQDRTSGRQCVGAAIAARPAGPFTPVGDTPLACPTEIGGAIDPAAFVDRGGRRYLVYNKDGNAIGVPTYLYVQRVADDGVTLRGAPIATIRNGSAEGNLIEAPFLVHRGHTYYMFYSYGAWNNDSYTEGYATAPSLSGPWAKSDVPLLSTALFGGSVVGPGGMSVLRGGADSRIVFHGVRSDPAFRRGLHVDDLSWRHGIPVAAGTSS
jgi:beta-xylosidase